MYYFYVLQSDLDNGYYYGSTSNLTARVAAHQKGEVTATNYRRPLQLVYYEAYLHIASARKREQQVKNSSSIRANIHKRIHPNPTEGPARPSARRPGQ